MDCFFFDCVYLLLSFVLCFFFFFKQKPAYERRFSDWVSDVCSSDLASDRTVLGSALAATAFWSCAAAVTSEDCSGVLGSAAMRDRIDAENSCISAYSAVLMMCPSATAPP